MKKKFLDKLSAKRVLFLFALGAMTLRANAQVEPENDGVYYLYNTESGQFLSRGNNWGTRGVTTPVGMPWKISIADGKYTLSMYDLTVADSTSGLGDNCFTDNDSPVAFTPAGTAQGYTLAYSTGYLMAPASAGDIDVKSATASTWQFLTQEQYAAKLAAKAAAQEKAITTLAGTTVEKLATEWSLETAVDDGAPTSETWPVTGVPDRGSIHGSQQNWDEYGGEIYQGGGRYTKTITGLKQGMYKLKVRAMKRVGKNTNTWAMGEAGYPVSDAYMNANGYIIPIKAWYEGSEAYNKPNSTYEFHNRIDRYTAEGLVYVGEDGKLELNAISEAYWKECWFAFNGVEYAHYTENETPTGVNTIKANVKAQNGKLLVNGRVVIMKNGVKYTTAGTVIK